MIAETSRTEPHLDLPQGPGAPPTASGLTSPAIDGLEIDAYAAQHHLSVAEVWRRLRRGELLARTERGRVHVYGPGANARLGGLEVPTTPPPSRQGASASNALPPLPEPPVEDDVHTAAEGAKSGALLAMSSGKNYSPELALLLDHLSLAKEENREVLRLAQQSIASVKQATEKLLQARDEQIEELKDRLAIREIELRRAQQEKEDLETLSRALTDGH